MPFLKRSTGPEITGPDKRELKKLKKYALKLSGHSWKNRILTVVLLLLGVFCVGFLVSSLENFLKSQKEISIEQASKIRVEVLNGSSIEGLAERVAVALRTEGFDVLGFGNADKCSTTVIFDRIDMELKNANFVHNALKQGIVRFEVHPLQLVDITVVLGEDFQEKPVKHLIGWKKTPVVQHK